MARLKLAGQGMHSTIRRHRPAYQVALLTGLLLLLGLVVMYALGPQRASVLNHAYGGSYSDTYFFNKQLVSVVLALAAFGACAFLPHQLITERFAKQLLIIGIVAGLLLVFLGAVLHLPLAAETNGAYRWYQLGSLGSFQPSELLKLGVLVFVAGFLGMRVQQGKVNDFQETLMPIGIIMAVALFTVVVLQKDLGTGLSLVAIVMAMLIASGMKARILGKIMLGMAAVGVLFIVTSPHRLERMTTYFQGDSVNRELGQDDNNYHIQQARIAIGSGGLLGLGIGRSVQATGYLPEATNDSIFAILGETFGFVGLVVIIALFTGLLLSILRVAARLPDIRLRLLVVGVFGWVASHTILNIAAMTGVAPLTGIPLPLLSQGGSSMLFLAAALGLVFQLSRYTSHKPLEGEAYDQDISGRRRLGRTRYASSSSL